MVMNFEFTDEHHQIRAMASEFARDKLAPNADKWDEECYFPIDILREAAKLGMAGMMAGEDIGGSQLTRLDSVLLFEQLATGCITTSAFLSIHNMVTLIIDRYANAQLRAKWGSKLTSMDVLGSYCLTEPESGSDAVSLKTKAQKTQDYYVLNGSKAFISGGSVSDVYVCMVRTGDETHHGVSCLLVEKNTPGLSFGKLEKKMGWHNQPTCMLYFENCHVPVANRIGEEGSGFKIALSALNGGRINIAACSLGGALTCLRLTHRYMNERKQFNTLLKDMQALRFYFAEMLTHFEAARLMVYRAAAALDKNDPQAPMYCAMAKRMATDVAFQISDKAMQLHGGYGYLCDYQIERIFRDLRVHQILEGTNEIMCDIIGKTSLNNEFVL
jgi:butyryl-CoA dehydrogenase